MRLPNISVLDESKIQEWNKYVVNKEGATFFHLAQWKIVIQETFQAEPFYLYAHTNNTITGILPLALLNRPFMGKVLISTPLCVYGGAIADDADTAMQLESAAVEIAEQNKVKYLELRYIHSVQENWPVNKDYYKFSKPLSRDSEQNFYSIPKRRRAEVRKAIASELRCESDNNVNRFFNIYARSLRNMGTPVFPKRYFEVLSDIFSKELEILFVSDRNTEICSLLSFCFSNQVHLYYIGGLPSARSLRAYDLVIWEQMKRACNYGIENFDLGRSIIGTGSFSSKKTWGIEPVPLNYQYYLVRSKRIPSINPLDSRYRPFIMLWKRMPLRIANYLGPAMSRIIA